MSKLSWHSQFASSNTSTSILMCQSHLLGFTHEQIFTPRLPLLWLVSKNEFWSLILWWSKFGHQSSGNWIFWSPLCGDEKKLVANPIMTKKNSSPIVWWPKAFHHQLCGNWKKNSIAICMGTKNFHSRSRSFDWQCLDWFPPLISQHNLVLFDNTN